MNTLTIQNQQAIRELITDYYNELEKHCKESLVKHFRQFSYTPEEEKGYQARAKAYCLEAMINECKSRQTS